MSEFDTGQLVRVTDPAHPQFGKIGMVWDSGTDYTVIDFHQADVLTVVPHNAIGEVEK